MTETWASPKEKAEHMLGELIAKNYPEKGKWKEFYLELTYIARDYFENIYFIHLQELTTTELIPVLQERTGKEYKNRLIEFFQFADLVKFAKGIASKEQCTDHFTLIRMIVNEYGERDLDEESAMD
jgi:hypothetical protein